jgi:uncharacterized membrane protein
MMRSKKTLLAALVAGMVFLLAPETVQACSTCFGRVSDSPLAEGMNMGIFTLLAVLGVVLAGLISFFVFLARRSSSLPDDETADSTDYVTDEDA